MTRAAFGAFVGASLVLLSAWPCLAQEVTLAYQAPAGCPTQADFVAAVVDRGARFQGEAATARARELRARVEGDPAGYVGVLEVTGPDGRVSSREIHDPTCGEVVSGLAVIAALALGARAQPASNESPDEAPRAAVLEQRHASQVPVASPTTLTRAQPVPSPRLQGTNLRQPETIPVKAGVLRVERDLRYTLGAGFDYGLLPGLILPRIQFAASTANFILPPSSSSYLVGPVLQVEWSYIGPGTHYSGDYSTRVTGFGASLNSCSGLTYDNEGLALLLCGDFGASFVILETESADGSFSREKQTGFGHVGLGFDAQYSLGDLFHVGLRLGGRAQLGDISAERPDGSRLFETPLFGAYGSAGIGLHF